MSDSTPDKRILSCSHCRRRYSVRGYDAKRQYHCKQCRSVLILAEIADSTQVDESYTFSDQALPAVPPGPAEPVPAGLRRDALCGTVINRCRLLGLIGRGGMGKVYLAHHTGLDKRVAVKILPDELLETPGYVARFKREAVSAGRLDHGNIIRMLDVGQENGRCYIVMEYVEGETVEERVARTGPLPVPEAVRVILDVCRGLQYAHGRNIVHRDIKPDNVIVGPDGSAKIADFGLAYDVEDDVRLTRTGAVMGTPAYMSPEQAKGKKATPASDQYSAGLTLYFMLTGERPFRGETTLDVLNKQVNAQPTPVTRLRPEVPLKLARLLDRMIAKDPGNRFESLEKVVTALEDRRLSSTRNPAVPAVDGPKGRSSSRLPKTLRPKETAWIAPAVAAGVVVIVGLFLLRGGSSDPPPIAKVARKETTTPPPPKFIPAPTPLIQPPSEKPKEPPPAPPIPKDSIQRAQQRLNEALKLIQEAPDAADRNEKLNQAEEILKALQGHADTIRPDLTPDDQKRLDELLVVLNQAEKSTRQLLAESTPAAKLLPAPPKAVDSEPVYLSDLIPVSWSISNPGIRMGVNTRFTVPSRPEPTFPLSIAGRTYTKGLGAYPQFTASFLIDERFVRFMSDVGVHDHGRAGNGSVQFRVYGDERILYESGIIRFGDQPQRVDIDISSVKMLRLEVNDAGDGPNGDQADWGDAKLLPAPVLTVNPAPLGPPPVQDPSTGPPPVPPSRPWDEIRLRFNSPDYASRRRTNEEFLQDLYEAIFKRKPDVPGMQFWIEKFRSGLTRAKVLELILDSPEVRALRTGGKPTNITADAQGQTGAPAPSKQSPAPKNVEDPKTLETQPSITLPASQAQILPLAPIIPFSVQDPRVLSGHSSVILSLAFNPDGRTLASAGFDRGVKIWDTATWREDRTLSGHTDGVRCLALSPNGKIIASGGYDKTVRLWDAATGEPTAIWSGHEAWVTSLAFSPNSRTLASGGYDGKLRLWDIKSGHELRSISAHPRPIPSVVFSSDGRLFATGSEDRTIKMWDTSTYQPVRTLTGHSDRVFVIAFHPGGKYLASSSWDATVRLWEVGTGETIRTLTGHKARILALACSPDGRLIASGSNDKSVKLWDFETGNELATLGGFTHALRALAFSPDGMRLAVGCGDITKQGEKMVLVGTPDTAIRIYTLSKGINLLSLMDPAADSVAGKWTQREDELESDVARCARIRIPYQPPQEYDLKVDFTRIGGDEGLNLILAAKGKQFIWNMGGWENTVLGFDGIGGSMAINHPSSLKSTAFVQTGRRHTAVVHVRNDCVWGEFEGKSVLHKTDFSEMRLERSWNLNDPTVLGIGTYETRVVVHQVLLTEIRGTGRKTR